MFHLNKKLRDYCERKWLLPIKIECFSGKYLKCFVADCKRRHQSKTAAFQLQCHVLILYSFPYKMRPWISKFCPQKSKNRSLPPPPYVRIWANKISIKTLFETFPHQKFLWIPQILYITSRMFIQSLKF